MAQRRHLPDGQPGSRQHRSVGIGPIRFDIQCPPTGIAIDPGRVDRRENRRTALEVREHRLQQGRDRRSPRRPPRHSDGLAKYSCCRPRPPAPWPRRTPPPGATRSPCPTRLRPRPNGRPMPIAQATVWPARSTTMKTGGPRYVGSDRRYHHRSRHLTTPGRSVPRLPPPLLPGQPPASKSAASAVAARCSDIGSEPTTDQA